MKKLESISAIVGRLRMNKVRVKSTSIKSLCKKIGDVCIRYRIDDKFVDRRVLALDLKEHGINEVSIPVKDFFHICGLVYRPKDLREFLRPYSYQSKFINDRFDSHLFRRNQIGSMYEMIFYQKPSSVTQWEEMLYRDNGDEVRRQEKKLAECIMRDAKAIAVINEKNTINKVNKIAAAHIRHFLLYKNFLGLSFQIGILRYLAKKLKVSLVPATDYQDSLGTDAYLDNIMVNVKPTSFEKSQGSRYFNKHGVIFITYLINQDEIIINYDDFTKARKAIKTNNL